MSNINRIEKQDIKRQLSLPAVVSYCIGKPVKAGTMIRCPFHNDGTPSCKVYADHFYCFGCKATGDVIEWVKRWENTDFRSALTICADMLKL